jgi:large subunit ribosomal protein L25
MKSVALTAYPRTLSRRGGAKKIRTSGRVPAVIYGRNTQPQNLEVTDKDLETAIHGAASEVVLVDLSVEKNKRLALIQSIQHHPLSGRMLHVDFHEVKEDEKVTVNVPVETEGEAAGVKTGGGVLEHVLFKVKVRAYPKDLPEVIRVDVTNLEIGSSIHLGELKAPEGVEILGHKEAPVVAIAAPLTEAQEAAATPEGTSPTQPEMIKEKKEEGAAAPAGDKKAAAAPAGEKKAAEKKK